MPALATALIVLGGVALFAAFVNGAIGYGFSSLTVPLALVFYTNRILNPAVVLIEVFLNLYVLFINRDGVPAVWRRVCPILVGLLPGIAIGAYVLALLQPGWIKLGTSTVSPPLAILFNNQGLVKNEFRAGLALVRVAESSVTALVYYQLGLFIAESANLLLVFIPSVLAGIPLGAFFMRHVDSEPFRRICMSFDAWVVGFGLSRVLIELNLVASPWAYGVMAVTILIDVVLLYVFFTRRKAAARRADDGAD